MSYNGISIHNPGIILHLVIFIYNPKTWAKKRSSIKSASVFYPAPGHGSLNLFIFCEIAANIFVRKHQREVETKINDLARIPSELDRVNPNFMKDSLGLGLKAFIINK